MARLAGFAVTRNSLSIRRLPRTPFTLWHERWLQFVIFSPEGDTTVSFSKWLFGGLGVALAFLALGLGRAQSSSGSPSPIGELVNVGSYRVHLYCAGAGEPAVMTTGAGYSFDWSLVQPEVAKFTRVCAYDHSGTAWRIRVRGTRAR